MKFIYTYILFFILLGTHAQDCFLFSKVTAPIDTNNFFNLYDTIFVNEIGISKLSTLTKTESKKSKKIIRVATKKEIKKQKVKYGILFENWIIETQYTSDPFAVFELTENAKQGYKIKDNVLPIGIEYNNNSEYRKLNKIKEQLVVLDYSDTYIIFKRLNEDIRYIHYFCTSYNINSMFCSNQFIMKLNNYNSKLKELINTKIYLEKDKIFGHFRVFVKDIKYNGETLFLTDDVNYTREIKHNQKWIIKDIDCITKQEEEEKERIALMYKEYELKKQQEKQEAEQILINKYGQKTYEKLKAGKVWIGCSTDMARLAWGEPNDINRTTTTYNYREQWVYGSGNYLYFVDGILTTIQN